MNALAFIVASLGWGCLVWSVLCALAAVCALLLYTGVIKPSAKYARIDHGRLLVEHCISIPLLAGFAFWLWHLAPLIAN